MTSCNLAALFSMFLSEGRKIKKTVIILVIVRKRSGFFFFQLGSNGYLCVVVILNK